MNYRWEITKETKDYDRGIYSYEARLVPTIPLGQLWSKLVSKRKGAEQCVSTGSPECFTG